MAQDIARKLRLTAAVLGSLSRKQLATAFRAVNPSTTFGIVRADKWLQGRAQPRETGLYDDWAKVLGIDRSGTWIADCDVEAFIAEISARHAQDPRALRARAGEATSSSRNHPSGLDLTGTYVCYSHSWSPYFRGRLVRGRLVVDPSVSANRMNATYSEALPTGLMALQGTCVLNINDLRIDVREANGQPQSLTFCLFPPKPPASVLGGMMMGTPLIGPDAQPSMTRVVMLRLPSHEPEPKLLSEDAYLPAGSAISADLAALGYKASDPLELDRCIADFLRSGVGGIGVDQVPVTAYRALVDLLDSAWLARR